MNQNTVTGEANDILPQYQREGYVIVPDVIDMDLVEQARDHIESLQQRFPDLCPEQFGTGRVPIDAFWLRLVSDARLLHIAEQFIGPNIALFASHYIAKPPRVGLPVQWHQDASFWPLQPMEVVTLWLALDDTSRENGCMQVIPGTQHDDYVTKDAMIKTDSHENVLSRSMDIVTIDETQAVDISLRAGDISVHNPNIVHGSKANTSDRWRRGLTIRYIPTTTRVTDPCHARPFLLQGKPIEGINDYNPVGV